MNFVPLMARIAEDGQNTGLPWWFWLILILVIVLIFLWLWFSGRKNEKEAAPAPKEIAEPAQVAVNAPARPEVEEPVVIEPKAPAIPEDLTIIEGIGPKINSVLHAAGINTFADLASADVGTVKKILLDANLRLADPTSWSKQAALARDGKFDELKVLQDSLSAGRVK
jgi:predicted flap endonuclease-1-like 5' DNA nuclease